MENLLCRLTSERVLLRVHDILIKGNTKTKDQLIEAEIEALKTATTVQELIQAFTPSLSKIWVEPSGCIELVKHVKLGCPNLKFSGLMTIGMADYSSTPKNFRAVAGFMFEVMDKSVLFNPSQIVLTAGAASAIEMGCSLRNTEYIVGAVIFTGQETKVSFYVEQFKFVDALAIYESVVEKDSENVEAHIGKGICLHMQNMGRPAFESFAEAIRLDPQNACALTHCGILYKDEGRLVEAAESYEKALRANSSYKPVAECLSIVLTDLGTSLKLAGNTQEGIQKYYEAIKIDQHYAPAYYNLGVVYSEMMQYDMALNCYEKAALERPMYAEAYCNMGVIYKNRGDLESAIADSVFVQSYIPKTLDDVKHAEEDEELSYKVKSRDALAKIVYSRLFDCCQERNGGKFFRSGRLSTVRHLSELLSCGTSQSMQISLKELTSGH